MIAKCFDLIRSLGIMRKTNCSWVRGKLRALVGTTPAVKVEYGKKTLTAMTNKVGKLKLVWMLKLKALLVRRYSLEEAIEGGVSPCFRTIDHMASGWG